MQVLKKENKIYCYHEKNDYGDYVYNNERYTLNVAREVYAPDNADLSKYIEVDSKESYVESYMYNYHYEPLTEEQIKYLEAKNKTDN